jgi:hypothetical protein
MHTDDPHSCIIETAHSIGRTGGLECYDRRVSGRPDAAGGLLRTLPGSA